VKATPALLAALKIQYEQGMTKYMGQLGSVKPSRLGFMMLKQSRKKIWLSNIRTRIAQIESALGASRG
jgi:hypothetical protein